MSLPLPKSSRSVGPTKIADLYRGRSVVICVGTGGVGKTTVAASIGLAAAIDGRRVAMLTIDPSKRLAQALDLDVSNPWAQPVAIEKFCPHAKGTLHAQMLDVAHTFDTLVRNRCSSEDEAQKILTNRIYKNFSQSLVGSHEYAAVEVLSDLHASQEYDLVVVDTPPSQNAIDFFGAPARILAFLSGQGLIDSLPGSKIAKRFSQKLFDWGGTLVQKTVGRIAGASTLEEVLAFLRSLGALYGSFEQRAEGIEALLHSSQTGFCLVGGPKPMQIAALKHFVVELEHHKLHPWGLVLNRMHLAPFGLKNADERRLEIERFLDGYPDAAKAREEVMQAADAEQHMAERDAQAREDLQFRLKNKPIFALDELSEAHKPQDQLMQITENLMRATA